MSNSSDADKIDHIDFSWGIKRGRGGTNKAVQFYESFTYDGVEYFLYDSVYLFKDGEPEPYVGKLIKIWEHSNKARKVKVLWFFYPCEISNYLGGENVLENELFLASGEDLGVANINPLEAIAGKCNTICISKDERNRQPSVEELKMADYVFFRKFDVGNYTISDELGEKIANVEVRFLLNKMDSQLPHRGPLCEVDCGKVVAGIENGVITPGEDKAVKTDVNVGPLLVDYDKGANEILDKSKCRSAENCDGAGPHNNTGLMKLPATELVSVPDRKTRMRSPRSNQTDVDGVQKTAGVIGPSENRASLKSKLGRSVQPSEEKMLVVNCQKISVKDSVPSSIAAEKGKSELTKELRKPIGSVGKVKSTNGHAALEERPSKKPKLDGISTPSSANGKNGTQKSVAVSIVKDKASQSAGAVAENNGTSKGLSVKLKSDGLIEDKSHDKLRKPSLKQSNDLGIEAYGCVKEVTSRPDADRSKWFTALPWEERMKAAYDLGTLVLLQNLDPAYTSSEVEDVVWHGFRESSTAKMVQHTATSSPHSGQAFVIFKTREAAEKVIKKLELDCLMLPNGRPLVGSLWDASIPSKQSSFPGHMVIDKHRHQMQRESRAAVSTSHSSQPNNIEFEMAIEWRLLQDRADLWWKMLNKQQGEQLKKLKASLKSK